MSFNGAVSKKGLLNGNSCEFSINAEFQKANIVSARGYFRDHQIYKVHWGTSQTLVDEETGIKFSIFITKENFSFSQGYENVEKLLG